MTRAGRRAAALHGARLTAFGDQAEAERDLLGRRDDLLRALAKLAARSPAFRPDGSTESLRELERWALELAEGAGFGSIGTDAEAFERATAMYLGEVLVRNAPPFEWFVAEFAFERGRYEIGVRRPGLAIMLDRLAPAPRSRNRRGDSLWRRYRRAATS